MLHVLVIGVGVMGRRHVKSLLDTKRCRVSCVDLRPASLETARQSLAVESCYEELAGLPNVFDGVIIATPAHTHVRFARWCVERELPFLVEKPLGVDEEGVAELVRDVTKSGLVAGVGYPRRSAAAVEEMRERLRQGVIGDLKMIHGTFSQDFRKYRPDYRDTYYARVSTGGGALLDALSHHVNLVTYFAGTVASVSAFYDRFVMEGCEGEDAALIGLRFENGIIGGVQGNQFQKPNIDVIELVGTAGNLRYDRLSGILAWNLSDGLEWEMMRISGDWAAILQRQAEEFLDAVERRGSLRTSLDDAWHTLRVVLAARQSQTERRIIELSSRGPA